MVVDLAIRSFSLSSSKVAPQTGASQTARQSATRTGFGTICQAALRIPTQLIENKRLTIPIRWPAVLLGHVLVAACPNAVLRSSDNQQRYTQFVSHWINCITVHQIFQAAMAVGAHNNEVGLDLQGIAHDLAAGPGSMHDGGFHLNPIG